MKHSGRCSKCGGREIIVDAKAVDRGNGNCPHDMVLITYRKPEAMIFKGRQHTTVSAWVCAACGYVELYADNPALIEQPPAS